MEERGVSVVDERDGEIEIFREGRESKGQTKQK